MRPANQKINARCGALPRTLHPTNPTKAINVPSGLDWLDHCRATAECFPNTSAPCLDGCHERLKNLK
jgi:hypothetical protein